MSDKKLTFLDDRHYTNEHVWIKTDGDSSLVGISDYAQDQLGEVAYVELPDVGQHFAAQEQFGTVESLKAVNGLFMPVAGTVEACNTALEESPTRVNTSCYTDGWMLRIKADDPASAATLMDAAAYAAFVAKKE